MTNIIFAVFRLTHAAYCEIVPRWARLRFRLPLVTLNNEILEHIKWIDSDGKNGRRLTLFSRNLSGYDLSKFNFERAILRDCDFRRCRFIHSRSLPPDDLEADYRRDRSPGNETTCSTLTEVDFSYSSFEQSAFSIPDNYRRSAALPDLTGACFVGCSGLFGADGAYFGRSIAFDSTNPPTFQRWLPGTSLGDFPSWEVVGSFQRLRLLGFSNTLAIFFVFYGVVVAWYNSFISELQSKVSDFASFDSIAMLISQLSPLPVPAHFGNLLLVISILFVTNIIYVYLDPFKQGSRHVIEVYSPDNDGVFRSLSARYSNLLGRWICFVFLSFCVIYLLNYFFRRLLEAFHVYFPEGINLLRLFSS